MKRIMFVCFLLIGLRVSAQDWKVVEWPDKSQSEIRSAVKVWIADYFKSAKDVIQLDEPDRVMVKGSAVEKDAMSVMGNFMPVTYTMTFALDFQLKDRRYRYQIKDVLINSGGAVVSLPELKKANENNKLEAAKLKGIAKKSSLAAIDMVDKMTVRFDKVLFDLDRNLSEIPKEVGNDQENW